MNALFTTTLLGLAVCLTSIPAYAQNMKRDKLSHSKKPPSATYVCPSLDEAAAMLRLMDDKNAIKQLAQDAKQTRDRNCLRKTEAAGVLLRDLMLATVRQDASGVCALVRSQNSQNLLMKMTQVAYQSGGKAPCKIMTQ